MKYLPKVSHLQALRQVARSGSIRSAARELGQSQPALSRTLRELEQTLGTQLLLRSKEGITLTEAGSAFSQRAEWVLEELRRAADEVEQINHATHGRLTIGYSSLIALTVFPAVADAFKQALPQVALTLKEGQLSSLLPGVRNWNAAVHEELGKITFIHRIAPGAQQANVFQRLTGIPLDGAPRQPGAASGNI